MQACTKHNQTNNQVHIKPTVLKKLARGYDVMRFYSMGLPALHHLSPLCIAAVLLNRKKKHNPCNMDVLSLWTESLIIFLFLFVSKYVFVIIFTSFTTMLNHWAARL